MRGRRRRGSPGLNDFCKYLSIKKFKQIVAIRWEWDVAFYWEWRCFHRVLILLLLAGRTVCSRQVKNSKWSKLADTRFNHSNHYSFKRQSCTFASSFLNFPAQVETYGDYSKCPKCEKNIKSTFIIRHIKVYSHIWNIFFNTLSDQIVLFAAARSTLPWDEVSIRKLRYLFHAVCGQYFIIEDFLSSSIFTWHI